MIKHKVPLRLDDNSPRCTYPEKDTTENAFLEKSTLPNVKCIFKFNILIYSQKSDLLIYFEKRGRVLHKVPYFLNFKWEVEVYLYFLFSLTLHLSYYLLQPFCKFCQYTTYTTTKDLLRSYCFSLLDLCRKCNLKNIAFILGHFREIQ